MYYFKNFFLVTFWKCIFDLCAIVLIKGFGLWLFFSSQREIHSVANVNFALLNYHIFCPSSCYYGQNYEMYSNHFDGEL